MEDRRGEEHVKLATEYGKTQLNAGHLVDAQNKPRGQGVELRTDEHGAVRGGKGIFISADAQPKAQGQVMDNSAALREIECLQQQVKALSQGGRRSQCAGGRYRGANRDVQRAPEADKSGGARQRPGRHGADQR